MALLVSTVLSCSDVFDTHPYDVSFEGEKAINSTHIAQITARCANKDTLRVVVTSDTQGWYDETKAMVSSINRLADVDFVIHGGDFSNYGATKEFVWQREIFDHLQMPYVALIGNHDCLGTGVDVFRKMYGDTNFSFIAGRVKFICLNTNALEYDFSEAIPDFDFLEAELHKDQGAYDRTVFCMHAPPFNEQFNNQVVNAFNHYLERFPSPIFCTHGHLHRFVANDLFGNGIVYYCSDSANHRNYLLFTITPSGYSYEVIDY